MVFSSNELNLLVLHNGKDGVAGNSKYTWVKYSQNPNGSGMTDDSTNALYIGLAYNKDSKTESSNPSDYSWTKIKGDNGANGKDGKDAYTVILSNENVSFSVNKDKKPISNQTHECNILVFKGTEVVSNFVIDKIQSANGINVSQTTNKITLSASTATPITLDSGSVKVNITINNIKITKEITWSLAIQGDQGKPGIQGVSPIQVVLHNSTQSINCDSDGLVNGNVLITVPFSAYNGTTQVEATATIKQTLPSGMTIGSNTPSTATSNGEIVFNIADKATLGNAKITSGNIPITFSVESKTVSQVFTWTKVLNGESGVTINLTLSSTVVEKKLKGGLSPASITLSALRMQDGNSEPYKGRFIIEATYSSHIYKDNYGNYLLDESINLLVDNTPVIEFQPIYSSSVDESEKIFTFPMDNFTALRCTLCESGSVTKKLDQQYVFVLNGSQEIREEFTKVTNTISGVSSKVDNVEKSITNKVWQTDITTQINNYDGEKIQSIRDQNTQQEIKIDGIAQQVSDVESTLTTKADGSTVQALDKKVSKIEQDANGFKQTVEKTYATKTELGTTTETLSSQIQQNADSIEQVVKKNTEQDKSISAVKQTADGLKIEVDSKKDVAPSKIRYIRDWLNANNIDSEKHWTGIQVLIGDSKSLKNTKNIAKGIKPTSDDTTVKNIDSYTDDSEFTYASSTASGWHYLQIDLGATNTFDEGRILIIHDYYEHNYLLVDQDGNILSKNSIPLVYQGNNYPNISKFYDHKLEISADGKTWYTLYDSERQGQYEETNQGKVYYVSDSAINNTFASFEVAYDGIKAEIKNHEGDISSLRLNTNNIQTNVNKLNEGQSSLTQKYNSISSKVQSVDGKLSKVEQTTNTLSSTVGELSGKQSSMEQTMNGIDINFTDLSKKIGKSFAFKPDGLYINSSSTDSNAKITLKLENDKISFLDGSTEVAYISDNEIFITDATILHTIKIGNFMYKPMSNGSLSFDKV